MFQCCFLFAFQLPVNAIRLAMPMQPAFIMENILNVNVTWGILVMAAIVQVNENYSIFVFYLNNQA